MTSTQRNNRLAAASDELTPEQEIVRAAALVEDGEVVVAPTDTHYTLLASAHSDRGTRRIYEIKERDPDFPLTVFLAEPELLDQVAVVDDAVRRLALDVWPGYLTLILPKRPAAVADHVTAGLQTVAVACHRHPLLRTLLRRLGGYAACTSANRSGQGAAIVTLVDAIGQVGAQVAAIIDGGAPSASAGNTILDLTSGTPVCVREGAIPLGRIRELLPGVVDQTPSYKADLKLRQQSVATWRPSLTGRTVVVTGAARGRGSELAKVAAMAGATVFVTDKDASGCSVAGELAAQGLRAHFLELDITRADAWEVAVQRVLAETGRIDVLINNAGYFDAAPLAEMDPRSWETAFAVNTTGAMNGIRAVSSTMGSGGSIVNVASVFGLVGTELVGFAYQASKGALLPVTRAAAVQLAGKGIRVNAVCPGLIRTPMTEPLFADPNTLARVRDQVPLRREVGIFDIVDAVLFLASPVSAYITGAVLPVDGGLAAC